MRPIVFVATVAVLLAAACTGDPDEPTARALVGADDLAAISVVEPPNESEPDFDIVGPAWEVEQPPAGEDEVYTIEVPVPDALPPNVGPDQLSIAAYERPTTDGASFWVLAASVEYDAEQDLLVAQARGRGVFAAAVPSDYWTVAPSADGMYAAHYAADQAEARLLAELLQDELAAARSWLIEQGYDEPLDTLGQPQRVFIRPLRGGRALAQPTAFGLVLLVSDRLAVTPEAVPAAVTHELFHLSQGHASQDEASTWFREATAEFAAVQRLGVEVARPQTDRSCANYARSITDTRGLNEYENWTFFAFLEQRAPGSVRGFLELQSELDAIEALRELAGAPLSELLGGYAGAYGLRQSYPLVEGLACTNPTAVAADGATREFLIPPLAGLTMSLEAQPGRRLDITIEASGRPHVTLWQGRNSRMLEADGRGHIEHAVDCVPSAAGNLTLVFGAGEEPVVLRVSVKSGAAC